MTVQVSPSSPTAESATERFERLSATARVVRVIHADLFGRQRAKQFPASVAAHLLGEGIAYSKIAHAEDLLGVPVDEEEFPQLKGHPDVHAYIEPGTAIVPPWEPDAVWVLAALWEGQRRSPLCARGQLASARDTLGAELGYTVQAAAEPEFYLFQRTSADRRPVTYSQEGVSYTMDRITDPEGAAGRIHRGTIGLGIGVTALNREFSPGQFEINLAHGEIVDAADRAFLLKTAVKELAIIDGLEAVFMAKPLTAEEGSSLHVHLSLWEASGQNVFAEGDTTSTLLEHAMAGVQAHAAALLAFASPTVNSYTRLHGAGLSPRTSNIAGDNRFTFIRVPAERGAATRFEVRQGDASASPHLLMAAIVHAARDGIQRNLRIDADGAALPRSLGEALAALRADAFFGAAFGEELVRAYTAIKQREIEAFESTVTDWEWRLYHSCA
ncbi:glutamine synthetase family protein [Sciscionella marina]|uniref:glutamine synthetase family protein n=1 Tax=Sciscionella marina TaxID=508770 RepID=UPI00036FE6A2|nr:glutamine synthetase family protein [Sciscionella marina]